MLFNSLKQKSGSAFSSTEVVTSLWQGQFLIGLVGVNIKSINKCSHNYDYEVRHASEVKTEYLRRSFS